MSNVRDQCYKRGNSTLQMTYAVFLPRASPAIRSYACSRINSGCGPANTTEEDS